MNQALPCDIQPQERSMHGGIEFELIAAAPSGVVLVQGTVTTEKADMFPGLKIKFT